MVIAAAFRMFGTGQIPARLGSILAGLAIILLTYRLACDLIGQEGALVAAFLVATDNLIVLTSRTARPEALTTMAILASLLAIDQYARRDRIAWAFLSGLLIAAGTMFHITVLGYILSFAILIIVLDRRQGRFPLRGATAYALGYAVGLAPFAAWLLTAPMGRAGFREEYLSRAVGVSLWSKFLQEGHRYSDLLGLNMLHGHGLESIPTRLPIPLFFLAASFLLWKLRRQWFYLELLLLTPTVLWLIYTANKSSRYLALLAPLFALAIGAAVAAAGSNRRLHRAVLALSCIVVVAQMSANFILLHAARNADYNKVAAELRSVIPPGQTAYGTITFWLALHDRPFISYERTDPWMAANQYPGPVLHYRRPRDDRRLANRRSLHCRSQSAFGRGDRPKQAGRALSRSLLRRSEDLRTSSALSFHWAKLFFFGASRREVRTLRRKGLHESFRNTC